MGLWLGLHVKTFFFFFFAGGDGYVLFPDQVLISQTFRYSHSLSSTLTLLYISIFFLL